MTTPAHRAAIAALDSARPTIARLESEQNSEDRAADLIEGWSAVETALRSLMGGSTLTGRALIHEVRTRQVITFEQANALAEFEAARARAERPDYTPTEADVGAAQRAFAKLDAGLRAGGATPAGDPSVAAAAPAARPAAQVTDGYVGPPASTAVRGRPDMLRWSLAAAIVIAIAAVGAWVLWPRETLMERAVALYKAGEREQASAAFERAARENPRSALPHIYLSRMARDVGNLTLARDEATKAIQAEPGNALALREMGAYLLTTGNYELARKFYVRAVEADPTDSTAQGYLGCALIRLGRREEGQRFLNRAGSGNWSSCGTMAPAAPGMPGAPPPAYPGAPPPQTLPPNP